MRIQHNVMAMNAYRNYSNNTKALSKNLERLSSGYKINRAGDDAAGLAISEKMRAQITGLEAAQKNVKDGISLVNTAEGAMQEVQDMLNRMVYLAQESANGTYDNEVDRLNLQKEMDQLNSEIDRIADSANFNGIKLLNGTLGLNTDAFTNITSVGHADATDGKVDLTGKLAAKDASYSDLHLEVAEITAAAPKFTVDLGSLAVKGAAATDKVTVSFGGNDIELTLTAGDKSANDIAGLLKTEIEKGGKYGAIKADGAAAAAGDTVAGIKIGNAAFSIGAAAGGAIEFTYMGRYATDGTFTAETDFTGTAAEAKAINDSIGMAVEVNTAAVADGTVSGDVVHDTTKVDQAQAAQAAGLAGIDLTLDASFVTQGGTLTIDGKTFMFQTDATAPTADNGETIIDVSKATTPEDRLHMAADLLSKQAEFTGTDGAKWKIGVENGTKIHIEQTGKTTTAGKELKTYEDLTAKISAKGLASAEKFAGAQMTIDSSKIAEGDILTIGDKQYVFSDKKTGTANNGDTVYVAIKGDAGENLKTAVAADNTLTAEWDAGTKVFTVRGKTAADDTPTILGKGLTLQIGDTSDPYNQLSVRINDIHAASLGTASLKIDNQQGAADAVDKIKAAINTISGIRGTLGATSNRLDHTANNLSVMRENITDAESSIRDTDIAEEMMSYTKNNILVQSAQAMLAQANQVPQGVLQLLQ